MRGAFRPSARDRLGALVIVALVGIALALGPGQPAEAQAVPDALRATDGEGGTQAVVIRGNRRIEVGTILSYMQIDAEDPITAADLNAAVRRLFDTGLFEDVKIIPQEDRIVVEVVENPSINQIAFEGNSAISDEDLDKIVDLRPRFPFSASAAEANAQAIIELYRRTGRYGAEVNPVIIERSGNRVDLVFEINEGELTEVKSIDFAGNRVFSDSRLREEIETSESGLLSVFISSDIYDPDRLELDKALLRQFYLSKGYADFTIQSTTVELAGDRSGFFITFNVEEGQQYQFGSFDVTVTAPGLEREDFLAMIPAEDLEGEVYDASLVEDIANDLTDLAGAKGFAFVQVQPRPDKDPENLIIDITFEVQEGSKIFIERIDIEGNTRTLDRVIRREIELVEGDAFDARKIRRARANIRKLDYFETVEVETEEGSAEDRAVLTVTVEEKSTGAISFGLGFASSIGPIGSISITERNFLGRGQVLRAQVTAAGDTQVYDFGFTEPRFLDRELSVGLRGFFIQDDRSDQSSFRINRTGFTPSVGFPLGADTDITISYEAARDDIDSATFASPAIQVDEGGRFKSSVSYNLIYDQRNDPIETTGGYLLTLNQEFAGLGGSTRFVKSRGTAKAWTAFFDNQVVVSGELEGGNIYAFTDDTQVNDRFFIGGETFRGFAAEGIGPRDQNTLDAVGGNNFVVARIEASFPLGLPEELGIFGGVFVDAGSLFGLDRQSFPAIGSAPAVTIDDGLDFRVAAGGLLFVDTPFGPLELSLGVPLIDEAGDEKELFRVSVGTRF